MNSSHLGNTLDALEKTIQARKDTRSESYTHSLLAGNLDTLLKKVSEEAVECALAAKDATCASAEHERLSINHLRYEAGDLLYHLLVLCARFNISNNDLAAELNSRMKPEERPKDGPVLASSDINRGK